MSDNPASKKDGPSSRDDAFWASLFEQEEKAPRAEREAFPNWEPAPEPEDQTAATPPAAQGDWQAARQLQQEDKSLTLTVTGFNKGGLLVVWRGLQGFVPASQLVNLPRLHVPAERYQALRQRVGHQLQLKAIEVDETSNRFILSERAALVNADQRDNVLRQLKPGQRRTGRVTNLSNFGAFVDLGGVEGLVHLSELSWGRVTHPSDVVRPDQIIEVLVLSVSPLSGRVALSLKQTQTDPWLGVAERYRPAQLVTGTVTNVANFGVFVELERGLEGLIHISQLAEGSIMHPRNVLQKGQTVTARVLRVEPQARRLALSLRELPGAES